MFKKENFFALAIIGLGILYGIFSAIVFISRGKKGVNSKIALGARIIILSALISSGGTAFGQSASMSSPDKAVVLYGTPPPMATATPEITAPPLVDYATPGPVPLYGTPPPTPTITNVPILLYGMPFPGDVNSDFKVNVVDALMIAKHTVGETPANFNTGMADVDKSGEIDIVDALLVAQKYVGIIDKFPDRSKE